FHNSGAIRAEIAVGPISVRDIFKVSPFQNTLVLFKLTGQQLKETFECDVERGRDRLQVSGLKYKYFSKKARPFGERVHSVEVDGEIVVKNGQVVKPEKIYSVVSNDYLAGHAEDKFLCFSLDFFHDTGQPLDQALLEWLIEFKVLDYKPGQRIIEIK
ncbi:unnamed protein product, partial [marine sediment metagenome]